MGAGGLRSRFHGLGIAPTSYADGVIRLAMPSVPLSINEAGAVIQALALVPIRASTRTPLDKEVLSASPASHAENYQKITAGNPLTATITVRGHDFVSDESLNNG